MWRKGEEEDEVGDEIDPPKTRGVSVSLVVTEVEVRGWRNDSPPLVVKRILSLSLRDGPTRYPLLVEYLYVT